MRYRSKINWNNPVELDRDIATQYGVVAAYPGKGYGSQRLFDLRNKYHGTLTNSPTWTTGKFGEPAISYNGTTQRTEAAFYGFNGSTNLGCSAWCRWDGSAGSFSNNGDTTASIARQQNGSSATFILGGGWSGTLARMWVVVGGSFYSTDSTTSIADNKWHHVVGTYDGANIKVYVDGALEGTTARTGAVGTPTETLGIASYGSVSDELWLGPISNVVLGKAWTDAQVRELYRNPFLLYWQPSPVRTFWMGAAPAAGGGLSIPIAAYHYNHSLRA